MAISLEEELELLSKYAGSSLDFVQGGGGNTSVKDSDRKKMLIKASGFRLSEVSKDKGFVVMDLPKLLEIIQDPSFLKLDYRAQQDRSAKEMLGICIENQGLRPSLEASFHGVLKRVVLHTHLVQVNVANCLETVPEKFFSDLCQLGPVLKVPYIPPGHALGEYIFSNGGYDYPILLLKNHGLIINVDEVAEAMALHEEVLRIAEQYFPIEDAPLQPIEARPQPVLAELAALAEEAKLVVDVCNESFVQAAMIESNGALLNQGPLIPDDVVYWGGFVPKLSLGECSSTFKDLLSRGASQGAVYVENFGVLVFGKSPSAISDISESLYSHTLIRRRAQNHGKLRALNEEDIGLLSSMEGEKYRQMVSAAVS